MGYIDYNRTGMHGSQGPGGFDEDYRPDWIGAEEQRRKQSPNDRARAVSL
jgi:hypothetical protein